MNPIQSSKTVSLTSRLRSALIVTALLPSTLTGLLLARSDVFVNSEGKVSLGFYLSVVMVYTVLAFLIWQVPRLLSVPFQRWMQTLDAVHAGTLSVTWPVARYREFDLLGQHCRSLIERLAEMIREADRTARKVASIQDEIETTCEQQVTGAHEQSQAVSETSSAAAELSRSSEQIGANIHNISEMADHVLAGMEKIKVATDQTNRILTSLNEKSKQIGHITELIDDVADQTNLLAVNASIEAARAGEQGRGFTVVADQIGKLADSTGKSTKDITALVEIIQHEMSNAIIAMEQSLVGVEEEIQLTKDSASKSREIAMNANQQISGSRQIADAIASIDQTMKQIVTDAQQAAAQAGSLSGVSEELRACMQRYQVGDSEQRPLPSPTSSEMNV